MDEREPKFQYCNAPANCLKSRGTNYRTYYEVPMWWWTVFLFGWVMFLGWSYQMLPIFYTVSKRTLQGLTQNLADPTDWPMLSVLVPARDEGPHIAAGLKSLLASDYPNLEIIAIDDRSRDETGRVMDELAATDSRLKVIHITELPDGWLGKNHAMHVGQGTARGEWLLFTDGDVVFAPGALRLAMRYSIHERLDMLTLFPHMIPGGYWESAVIVFFSLAFMAGTKPYLVRNPRDKAAYVGIGAFNLVRRSAYECAGGHRSLAMEILDDVRLGQMMKCNDFRCDILTAGPNVSVRWQHSLWGAICGLEKNGFAALHFSVPRLVMMTITLISGSLLPYVIPFIYPDVRALGYLGTIAIMHITFGFLGWKMARNIWLFPAFPFALLLTQFAFLRSGWMTVRQGGVRWRDTFYPLETLKANVYRPKP